MPLHLNIIARTNGVGLDRDVALIRKVAEKAGHEVTFSHSREISLFSYWFQKKRRFDLNLFIERVFPRWFSSANTNILIPNQERFPRRHLSRLEKIDHIFCKSKHALEIFQKHHSSCHLSGFTSFNLNRSKIPRLPQGILHLAGRSTLKGTECILDLWQNHPEWPTLTLLQHRANAPESVPKNIKLITEYLSDDDLIKLINEHPIHLCPSLSEGWGHYIVEAMSCGAMVITTNGPPMNELIQDGRGILVDTDETEPRHLGTNFKVDPSALERAIIEIMTMTEETRRSIQSKARAWMNQNNLDFESRFTTLLSQLPQKPRRP